MKLKDFSCLLCFSRVGFHIQLNSNKNYMYSSMGSLSFSPYLATMSPWNKEALISMKEELGKVHMEDAGMIMKLEKSIVCSPANPTLGFLSHVQLQVVKSKKIPTRQMSKVIDFLLEMEDKYFEYFCKILEQSNFEGKAKMLRERAKDCKRDFGKFEYKQHTCMCSNITKTSCMYAKECYLVDDVTSELLPVLRKLLSVLWRNTTTSALTSLPGIYMSVLFTEMIQHLTAVDSMHVQPLTETIHEVVIWKSSAKCLRNPK